MGKILYIAALEDWKYWIGEGDDGIEEYKKQEHGFGSDYTKKYKPKVLATIFEKKDKYLIIERMLDLMKRHGVENVRCEKIDRDFTQFEKIDLCKVVQELFDDKFNIKDDRRYLIKTVYNAFFKKSKLSKQ